MKVAASNRVLPGVTCRGLARLPSQSSAPTPLRGHALWSELHLLVGGATCAMPDVLGCGRCASRIGKCSCPHIHSFLDRRRWHDPAGHQHCGTSLHTATTWAWFQWGWEHGCKIFLSLSGAPELCRCDPCRWDSARGSAWVGGHMPAATVEKFGRCRFVLVRIAERQPGPQRLLVRSAQDACQARLQAAVAAEVPQPSPLPPPPCNDRQCLVCLRPLLCAPLDAKVKDTLPLSPGPLSDVC